MVTLTGFPAPLEPISAAWELRMTLSEIVKYLVLAVSISLLLLALGILAWQIIRCCSHTHTRYTQRETVNNDLMFSEEKSSAAENYSGAPSTKTVTANAEAFRLSRYFSLASYPSSASSQSDGETGEKVDGSLRFSVFYDQQQTQLVVTVLQAEGLFQDRPTRSLHPFVKIRLMFAESTVNMEEFNCDEVRDYDKFSRHTVLGEVRVPLERLHSAYPLELQEALQTPQKDLVGKLLLSLKFLPTSQRLEVGLLKIRTVLTQSHSNEALYARVTVQSNQSKLPYQKTSAVPRCSLTVFNKVLIFSLPEFPVEQCKVLVYVYESHTSKKSSKRLIGQLIVGKERSSEDEHWSLMMRSVRQPVAKWHSLLI
uniref:Synaptotagmin-2-like n=1 Tax=Salarias fasciatus TaxID=181472 RepID=A0A672HUM0_SALFA